MEATKYRAAFETAVKEFEKNYKSFAEHNKPFVSVESGIRFAAERAQKEDNIHRSAEIFRSEISAILSVKDQKDNESEKKLKSRLSQFAVKLFPVAKIALSFAGSIAEVFPSVSHTDIQGSGFSQFQSIAGGLGVILQVHFSFPFSDCSFLKRKKPDQESSASIWN